MNNSWEYYGKKIAKGPKPALLVMVAFLVVLSAVGYVGSWFGEAATVARQEFGPQAMLRKYEWFKDVAAALDKKQADISVYQSRLSVFREMARKEMDRTDKQQQAQWMAEVAGVKASYNSLASDWNSQISKFNWKPFLGDLPPGAEQLLTKEYAPYETN